VNAKGQPRACPRRGRFDGETLRLGGRELVVTDLERVDERFGNLVVHLRPGLGDPVVVSVIRKSKAKRLRRDVVIAVSSRRAEQHQARLEAAGAGDAFHIAVCPACDATIDLSGFADSPQFYCRSCDTVVTEGVDGAADERHFHHCESCGFYARPSEFTIACFMFLLVAFAWSSKRVRLCHACVRPEAWKMLLGNLPFLLLVPVAIIQVIRAHFGGAARSEVFAGLDGANRFARRGRVLEAAAAYDRIHGRAGAAAGIRFNHGLAQLRVDDVREAADRFEAALRDCANYEPAAEALVECCRHLETPARLEALQRLGLGRPVHLAAAAGPVAEAA
jgi:hypothetical protein